MRRLHGCAILVGLFASSIAFAANCAAQVAQTQPTSNEEPYRGPAIALQIVAVMTEDDLAHAVKVLEAAEPQRIFIRRFFDKYLMDANAAVESAMPGLRKLSRQAGTSMLAPDGGNIGAEIKSISEQQVQLRDEIARLDAVFFSETESVLSETQKAKLPRLKLMRARQRSDRSVCCLPSAAIDLTELIRKMSLGDQDAGAIDSMLHEYELAVTPAMVEFDEAHRRLILVDGQIGDNLMKLRTIREADARDRREELIAHRLVVRRRQAELQIDIARINHEVVTKISETLSTEASRAFLKEFRLQAYRNRVYPDAMETKETIDALLAHRALTAGEQEAVDQLQSEFEAKYRAVSKQMEDLFDDWRSEYIMTMTTTLYLHDVYTPKMRKFREERWQLNKGFVEQIANIMQAPPDAPAGKAADTYRALYQRTIEQAATDQYPGT